MTVKDLKHMLREAPDDMKVMVLGESALDGFLFLPACIEDSGIIELPPPDEGEVGNEQKIFAIMPHGATTAHDDEDEESETEFHERLN